MQSGDCAAHSRNPEIACQSRDCVRHLRNLEIAQHGCAISRLRKNTRVHAISKIATGMVASCPGLRTPAFVARSSPQLLVLQATIAGVRRIRQLVLALELILRFGNLSIAGLGFHFKCSYGRPKRSSGRSVNEAELFFIDLVHTKK